MLEMILVQAAENDRSRVESLVEEFAIEMRSASHDVEMSVYRHAAITTDLCIMLKSTAGPHAENATHVGFRVAASLKSIGLVDHTCWIEWPTHDRPKYGR